MLLLSFLLFLLEILQYGEALVLETSSGGSDTDTLRLQAGTIVDFLDWALPETPRPPPSNGEGVS